MNSLASADHPDERVLSSVEIPLGGDRYLVLPNDGVATQIANPRRATLRTALAAITGLVLVLNPALLIIIDVLRGLEPSVTVPPVVFVILNGLVLVTTAVIAGVTRILAIPGVNGWISRYAPSLAPIKPLPKHAAL